MDLERYLHVLWRFKYVVAGGLVLAAVLSALTILTAQTTWASHATLLVTQQGFPEGRSVFPQIYAAPPGRDSVTPPYADPSRFSSLALLYAQLAEGDAVHARMLQDGPVPGSVTATPVTQAGSATPLPLIQLTAEAHSAKSAAVSAARGVRAFLEYLSEQQQAAGIQPSQRVVVEVVSRPSGATIVGGRKLTLPVLVFLAVLVATIAAAFGLENVRPARPRATPALREERPVVEDIAGNA